MGGGDGNDDEVDLYDDLDSAPKKTPNSESGGRRDSRPNPGGAHGQAAPKPYVPPPKQTNATYSTGGSKTFREDPLSHDPLLASFKTPDTVASGVRHHSTHTTDMPSLARCMLTSLPGTRVVS